MGAVLCGMTELADMMTYFKSTSPFYKDKFQIEKTPSKPTLRRIIRVLNPDMESYCQNSV